MAKPITSWADWEAASVAAARESHLHRVYELDSGASAERRLLSEGHLQEPD